MISEGYKSSVNLSLDDRFVDTYNPYIYWRFSFFYRCQQEHSKNFPVVFWKIKKQPVKSFKPHVDTYVVSVQINFRQGQRQSSLCRAQERKEKMIMEKMMNTKTEGNTFTKKIGQTVYVVRYHFNEDAKETMQEKINRMLVTEASRMAVY